jgi:hypothetical protein
MKKTFGVFSFILYLAFIGVCLGFVLSYAENKLAQSTPCSMVCGCDGGNGCSCVAANADKCECKDCTCGSSHCCCKRK